MFFSENYYLFSIIVILLITIPFFVKFEKSNNKTSEIVLLGTVTALSIGGRFIFAGIPGFKPVTAIIIMSAIYFGKDFGFLTGALSAFISNFGFGQGPWTLFQIFAWGIIGFIAGALKNLLKNNRIILYVYAFISGCFYSLFLDIWSVIWIDNYFNFSRYIAAVISSAPFIILYSFSNVLFIFLLKKPIDKSFNRLINKYGVYSNY